MKRKTVILSLSALALAGAAVASPIPAVFGAPTGSLGLDAYAIHADRTFDRLDTNDDGKIDVDEYAASAVVEAELTRLNRLVVIEGQDTAHVSLPEDVPMRVALTERGGIDAVARRTFYRETGGSEAMTKENYRRIALERFAEADTNGDGVLRGRELSRFARHVAASEPRVI